MKFSPTAFAIVLPTSTELMEFVANVQLEQLTIKIVKHAIHFVKLIKLLMVPNVFVFQDILLLMEFVIHVQLELIMMIL
jgi:hypothetical protein